MEEITMAHLRMPILRRRLVKNLIGSQYTARCRYLLKKELFIAYLLRITLSAMRFVKKIALKDTITIIMFTSFAVTVKKQSAWKVSPSRK